MSFKFYTRAEVWLNDYVYTAGRTEDMSLNQLAKKFPNAKGVVSFSLEKGGFTFRGYTIP